MNLTNEISFDKKLTQNQMSKINYNGYLAQQGAESVTMVYGYGADWRDTDSTQMQKAESGFEAQIKIKPYNQLNFCFRDENFNWDNNYGNNYSSDIEVSTASAADEFGFDDSEIQKIEEEISQLFDTLFATIGEDIEKAEANDTQADNIQDFNLDDLINEILTPILSEQAPVFVPVDDSKNIEVEKAESLDEISNLVEEILNSENFANSNAQNAEELENNYDDLITNLIDNTENFAVEEKSEEIAENIQTAEVTEEVENVQAAETTEESNDNVQVVETTEEVADNIQEIAAEDATEDTASNIQEAETLEQDNTEVAANVEQIETNNEEQDNIQEIETEDIQETVQAAKIERRKKNDFTVIEEMEEEIAQEPSLLESEVEDARQEAIEHNTALTVVDEDVDLVAPRKLSKVYMAFKKIRLAVAKLIYGVFKDDFSEEN